MEVDTPVSHFKVPDLHVVVAEAADIQPDQNDGQFNRFLKVNKVLIMFFKVAGIRFATAQNNVNQTESIWFKVYRILLVLLALFHAMPNVVGAYIVLKSSKNRNNFLPAYQCDSSLFFVLMMCYWANYSRITTIIGQLKDMMDSLHLEPKIFALFWRCNRIIVGLGVAGFLITTSCIMVENYVWDDFFVRMILNNCYFIYAPTPLLKPILAFVMMQYHFLTACIYLHFSMIILIVYMIHCCFKQLNHRLKYSHSLVLNDLHHIQHKHQCLASLVEQTNKAFSPTLFVLMGVKCAQIIFGVNIMQLGINLYTMSNNKAGIWNHIIKMSLTYANAVGFIVTLTVIGGKLHKEAQKTIKDLLRISLQNDEMYSNENLTKVIEGGHITNLFTSQRIASPISLSASGLFDINYSFLALVISTTVTYMTLMPSA